MNTYSFDNGFGFNEKESALHGRAHVCVCVIVLIIIHNNGSSSSTSNSNIDGCAATRSLCLCTYTHVVRKTMNSAIASNEYNTMNRRRRQRIGMTNNNESSSSRALDFELCGCCIMSNAQMKNRRKYQFRGEERIEDEEEEKWKESQEEMVQRRSSSTFDGKAISSGRNREKNDFYYIIYSPLE